MRKDIIEKENDVLQMIANNDPKAMICRFLNCRPEVLEKYLKLKGIKYSGNRRMVGRRNHPHKKSVDEYLAQDRISIHKLRIKLIEEGIKKNECENCKLTEWCGSKIPLELHHIDGNKLNNDLNNLQILCPNCHALTPNHAGKKNKKKFEDKAIHKRIKLCKCGKTIKKTSNECLSCYHEKQRKIKNANLTELIDSVNKIGYLATGRKYGVSDNTIRKYINKK